MISMLRSKTMLAETA